jgi:Uma2 family endonuclease
MARPPAIETETALWLALDVSSLRLTDDQLLRLFRDNDDFQFELSAKGELIIMAPATPNTDERNVTITTQLRVWTNQDGTGRSFGPTAMFTLPNGAKSCPDASWIPNNRWNRLTQEEKDSLAPICPDFVIELRSKSDRLKKLKEKMEEYMVNGVRLSWLLDPVHNCATIYRPGRPAQEIDEPTILSGDPLLPGFQFDFREIL